MPELCTKVEKLAASLLPTFDRVATAALNSKLDAPYITGNYMRKVRIDWIVSHHEG